MKKIDVAADIDSLELVNSFVMDLALGAALVPARAYLLRLATEELAINIMAHGYADSGKGRISLEGAITDTEVWIRLTDTADPFDPFQVRPPRGLDRPLQDREPGSLGLYLVNHAVDRGFHEYVRGANRTTIVMSRVAPADDGQVDSVRDNADREPTESKRGSSGSVADAHGRRSVGRNEFPRRSAGGTMVGRPYL